MPNRLADSTSPYLLQHKDNPVDWYPWGDEALQRAIKEDKPIFLSIGYSACHWCHVMERESFENVSIAQQLNKDFVCIKVDREERPDLDHIYMQSVQIMTRRGGWPMSVFLTPDLQPFFGGTYWPPTQRMGMPGFNDVIDGVIDAWNNRRDAAIGQAVKITELIQGNQSHDSALELNDELLSNAVDSLADKYDVDFGGFGKSPKFPHPMDVRFLLRLSNQSDSREQVMATHTLDCMANGGIYDHLGGGFARYSVDRFWLVPHFEKMLYDN